MDTRFARAEVRGMFRVEIEWVKGITYAQVRIYGADESEALLVVSTTPRAEHRDRSGEIKAEKLTEVLKEALGPRAEVHAWVVILWAREDMPQWSEPAYVTR